MTNTALLEKMNAGLKAVTEDGTLDSIKAKWLQIN